MRAGIEPARGGFADRSVTTSPPHLFWYQVFKIITHLYSFEKYTECDSILIDQTKGVKE